MPLGFNIVLDERNNRTRITPQLIAGSALIAGSGTTLTAGDSYSWLDTSTNNKQNPSYWLEDIDLNGQSNRHGPFVIKPSVTFNLTSAAKQRQLADQQQAATLASLGTNVTNTSQSAPPELRAKLASAGRATLSAQTTLAAQKAVKLSIKQSGWYRVSAQELLAAGFTANPDPRLLQMFVNGQEVPIAVTGQNSQRFDSTSAIEFYGIGLDAAYSDARVYWLIAGSQPGKRITTTPDQGLSIYDRKQIDHAQGDGEYHLGASFSYPIERKDKILFFQGLNNGEEENSFAPARANTPVDQSLLVQHLDQTVPALATLQVTLQGLTTTAHQVTVSLNGGYLGVVSFDGQAKGTAAFSVLQSMLKDGNNVVTLVAQDGNNDVSLVDTIWLTYHQP